MFEAELKCRLTPEIEDRLEEELQEMEFKATVHNRDIYYDNAAWDLLQQAVFVRVRNAQHLEFKFNKRVEQMHTYCTEYTFPLEPAKDELDEMNRLFACFLPGWFAASNVVEAMKKNVLLELACIDNTRKIYAHGMYTFSVDTVVGLGNFLEIEAVYEEERDTSKVVANLQTFATRLKAEHLKVGYVELWLREHKPQAYRAGKYQL